MGKWKKKWDDKRIRGRAGLARSIRVKERAGYTCESCGMLTTDLEADHKIPLFKGGADKESNMQALCKPCHFEKTRLEIAEALRLSSNRATVCLGADGWPDDGKET